MRMLNLRRSEFRKLSQCHSILKDKLQREFTGLAIGSAGELWVGTEAGVDRFDGRTFAHYLADPSDHRRLSPRPQRSVAQDSHGAVWTGTYGGGLDRLDGDKVKHFHHEPKNDDSPANDYIASLVADTVGGMDWSARQRA
jgi:ligand-binding sensor domain-containing protein